MQSIYAIATETARRCARASSEPARNMTRVNALADEIADRMIHLGTESNIDTFYLSGARRMNRLTERMEASR